MSIEMIHFGTLQSWVIHSSLLAVYQITSVITVLINQQLVLYWFR
jgi:hypothetical protein